MKVCIIRFCLFLIIFSNAAVFAQKRIEEFTISIPLQKVDKSFYKSIKVYDKRLDTTSLGIVQQGAFNAKARVIGTAALESQFQTVLENISNETVENGKLVVYIRQLYFAEVTKAFSEYGYCYFQSFMFAENENGSYSLIDKTDTVIEHKAADVTKEILRKGSDMLGDFIAKNVSKRATDPTQYTLKQISHFEDIDKQSYKLFSTSTLKDGIYPDYKAFKNLEPEKEISNVKFYGNMPKITKIYESAAGKDKEIRKDNLYAIVYRGEPYIYLPIENLFTKAEKRGNDFYFIGKLRQVGQSAANLSVGMFFGVLGAVLTSNPAFPFEQKIDYMSGAFIPIQEISSKKY